MKLVTREHKITIAVIAIVFILVVVIDFASTILMNKSNMVRRIKTSRTNAYRVRTVRKKEQ